MELQLAAHAASCFAEVRFDREDQHGRDARAVRARHRRPLRAVALSRRFTLRREPEEAAAHRERHPQQQHLYGDAAYRLALRDLFGPAGGLSTDKARGIAPDVPAADGLSRQPRGGAGTLLWVVGRGGRILSRSAVLEGKRQKLLIQRSRSSMSLPNWTSTVQSKRTFQWQ